MNPNPTGSDPFGAPLPPAGGSPPQAQMVRVALPRIRPTVTYSLIAVTAVFYVLQQISISTTGNDALFEVGGKINQYIYLGQFWRLITPVLLHADIFHILFNMYALFIIGREVELAYGHGRFLLLYLMGGFAGNVFSFIFTPGDSLGSSTAIFGLVAAEAVFFYQNRRLFGSRTRGILLNLGVIVVINLFLGITPGSNIDNFGHLGGLLGGALFSWLGGPNWKVEGVYPDLHVVDVREQNQVVVATLTVLIFFGGLTFLRFLIK
jgi:rhomboid protease GluP